MGEGGEVAQLQVLVAFDAEAFTHGGEDFGLFDGVDAEVGLEVQVEVEKFGGVAGHLGHDAHNGCGDIIAGGRGCWYWLWCLCCGAGLVADPADDVGERREVAQLQVLVAFNAEAFTHGGEDFGLLDGVDAEVGFEV